MTSSEDDYSDSFSEYSSYTDTDDESSLGSADFDEPENVFATNWKPLGFSSMIQCSSLAASFEARAIAVTSDDSDEESSCTSEDDSYCSFEEFEADDGPPSLAPGVLSDADAIIKLLSTMRSLQSCKISPDVDSPPKSPKSIKDITVKYNICHQDVNHKTLSPIVESPEDDDPLSIYKSILQSKGYVYAPQKAADMNEFFLPITEERINMYCTDIVSAVQNDDIAMIKERYSNDGVDVLLGCNKFGESMLHRACRYSKVEIIEWMMNDAEGTLRVCDDFGRTPLHDACWSSSPNFDLVRLLLRHEPDLLLVGDSRGCTPLGYVPKKKWSEWCEFLRLHEEQVLPRRFASTRQDSLPCSQSQMNRDAEIQSRKNLSPQAAAA